jgi:iron complex outermembrane receptor protein
VDTKRSQIRRSLRTWGDQNVPNTFLLSASTIVIALFSTATMAQTASPAVDNAADTGGVAEIVVTAQRRNERLQDVPLSVTAVDAEALSRSRINDASRLQFVAPGLTWGSQGSDAFPAIRGVRTQLVSAQSDPVIGFYIDGIYQSRTQQQTFPLFDIARVEVLRGPQGTLYGRNTFGGNISIVTQEPTKDLSAGFNASLGNYDMRQFDAFINVPIADNVQLRVAGDHIEHSGYVHSSTTPSLRLVDENQTALRASLKITPTPELEILLHGAYWDRNDAGGGAYGYKVVGTLINPSTGKTSINGSPYAVNPSVRPAVGSVYVAGTAVGVPVSGDPYTNQWDYQPFENLREKYGSGQISYDFGPVVLKSITGYNSFRSNRSADLDQSSVVFPAVGVASAFAGSGIQAADTRDKTFTQELQLASNSKSSPLQWIVGAYYLNDKVTEFYSQLYTAPTATALGSRSRTAIITDAYAVYGQATYSLIPDKLRLIGGIRYSDETKKYDITNFSAPTQTWDFSTQTAARASGEAKYNKVTWRAGAEFNLTTDSMLYGTVSTGFESGGINNNSSNALIPSSYAPQTVTAYEVGSKNRLMDGHVVFNVSAFYNKYKNLQITILDPATNFSYYASAGAARSYGAEFEVKTVFYPGLHLDLTAALLNAKFTQYVRPNPFGDTTTVNLAGKRVPMSPTLKTTASLYYEADLGKAGTLAPHIDWLYSTHYYGTDYNTVLDRQKAYNVVDLSMRWTDANAKYYFEGFADNIGNQAVLYSATLGGSARIQESFGPPRVYGLRMGAKF